MMQRHLAYLLFSSAILLASMPCPARDTIAMWPIKDALTAPDALVKLDKSVSFYFGPTAHPEVERSFGTFQSNKKTNGTNKSDKEACERAFLSAMITLQQRAQQVGGNAVINIKSYYKKHEVSSEAEYECGSGALMSGVTIVGEVVKLK